MGWAESQMSFWEICWCSLLMSATAGHVFGLLNTCPIWQLHRGEWCFSFSGVEAVRGRTAESRLRGHRKSVKITCSPGLLTSKSQHFNLVSCPHVWKLTKPQNFVKIKSTLALKAPDVLLPAVFLLEHWIHYRNTWSCSVKSTPLRPLSVCVLLVCT